MEIRCFPTYIWNFLFLAEVLAATLSSRHKWIKSWGTGKLTTSFEQKLKKSFFIIRLYNQTTRSLICSIFLSQHFFSEYYTQCCIDFSMSEKPNFLSFNQTEKQIIFIYTFKDYIRFFLLLIIKPFENWSQMYWRGCFESNIKNIRLWLDYFLYFSYKWWD